MDAFFLVKIILLLTSYGVCAFLSDITIEILTFILF
jgi:hypothetical protein